MSLDRVRLSPLSSATRIRTLCWSNDNRFLYQQPLLLSCLHLQGIHEPPLKHGQRMANYRSLIRNMVLLMGPPCRDPTTTDMSGRLNNAAITKKGM